MDIINFLFSIHDYNEVGDLFRVNWSMSMVFVCAFIMYIITIPFIFITKKKAKAFCEKYYPDEKILLISTIQEFTKIKMAIIWSFGYAWFVLPFVFFKNLNQIALLTKELMPLFLIGYTFLVFIIMSLMVSSVHVLTNKTYVITFPYQWFINAAGRKNKFPGVETKYKNIKSVKHRLSFFGSFIYIELINDPTIKEYGLHKHLKQAQKIIENYIDKDGRLDYDDRKEEGNSKEET